MVETEAEEIPRPRPHGTVHSSLRPLLLSLLLGLSAGLLAKPESALAADLECLGLQALQGTNGTKAYSFFNKERVPFPHPPFQERPGHLLGQLPAAQESQRKQCTTAQQGTALPRRALASGAACHAGGNNAVQPDKKLKKEALETLYTQS